MDRRVKWQLRTTAGDTGGYSIAAKSKRRAHKLYRQSAKNLTLTSNLSNLILPNWCCHPHNVIRLPNTGWLTNSGQPITPLGSCNDFLFYFEPISLMGV
jgi:hypothetical protein